MLIPDFGSSGAVPALKMAASFAAQRQDILAHNVANISTPDFRPLDAPVAEFQETLSKAIDRRRSSTSNPSGREFSWSESSHIRRDYHGRMRVVASEPSDNVLFHDRNNRDVERLMQDVAENVVAFRLATDLLKSRNDLIRTAIAGRVA
ncbi:MAG: flagellar basal body rod protein FlgB [Phycisphaerales bacterium]